jgi:hypothetical protein
VGAVSGFHDGHLKPGRPALAEPFGLVGFVGEIAEEKTLVEGRAEGGLAAVDHDEVVLCSEHAACRWRQRVGDRSATPGDVLAAWRDSAEVPGDFEKADRLGHHASESALLPVCNGVVVTVLDSGTAPGRLWGRAQRRLAGEG